MNAKKPRKKQKIEDQLCVIYGYHSNYFSWQDNTDRTVYHTTGLIFEIENNYYVLTTRSHLISCKNIIMYHRYLRDNEIILRNDLRILFQSIEYNIIILVSENKNSFDPLESEIISGDYDKLAICPSYIFPTDSQGVPTKRSKYSAIKTNMDLTSDTLKYEIDSLNVKYLLPFMESETFLPAVFLYKYRIDDTSDMLGIIGSVIVNKKNQLIGIVSKSISNNLFVLPTILLSKIVFDFANNLSNPDAYEGLCSLNICFDINNQSKIEISENNIVKKENDTFILKKNDIINKIDGKNPYINNDIVLVYDSKLGENIPIDIYFQLNSANGKEISLEIDRFGTIINLNIVGSINRKELSLTNIPYFNPDLPIPFINLGGIIIVEFTHELLDIMFSNKIYISNKLIDNFIHEGLLDNELEQINNMLLIIDCLDNNLAKKYNLPQLKSNNSHNVVPFVTKINDYSVSSLCDIENIISDISNNFFLIASLDMSTKYSIDISM